MIVITVYEIRDMGLHIHWGIVNEGEANEDSKWFQDVVVLFVYVTDKHLRSCRDGQLT